MQQFFSLVHTLLASSPSSKQRQLGIRTYRVVPCSPLVGVVEWVEGTTPFTDYLLGEKKNYYAGGASARYAAAVTGSSLLSIGCCPGAVYANIHVAAQLLCIGISVWCALCGALYYSRSNDVQPLWRLLTVQVACCELWLWVSQEGARGRCTCTTCSTGTVTMITKLRAVSIGFVGCMPLHLMPLHQHAVCAHSGALQVTICQVVAALQASLCNYGPQIWQYGM